MTHEPIKQPRQSNQVSIDQSVAILIDGNNIELSLSSETHSNAMLNFDQVIPRLLGNRSLNRLVYFREGKHISTKLAERLHSNFHGSVRPCHKSADIPLAITAMQLSTKVDTIIILSGDSDYVELVKHLRRQGVRVEICAVPATTAQILIDESDYFHTITVEDSFTLGNLSSHSNHSSNKNFKRPNNQRSRQKNAK